jgi:hypothetical protein
MRIWRANIWIKDAVIKEGQEEARCRNFDEE